jgi:hypothetical protein
MARLVMPRMRPLTQREWTSALVVLVSIATYFVALMVMDNRAAAYFRETRASDPDLYLEQLRSSRGFEAYLPEYAVLKGFEQFAPHPPAFLIGRWTMRDEPVRLTPGERPAQCSDPITFDYGLILMVEPESVALPVSYRIAEGKIEVRSVRGESFSLSPVSFGGLIEYLEFVPPGRSEPVYAYFCGG